MPIVMTPPRNIEVMDVQRANQHLSDKDMVLGLEYNDEARAYPRDLIARPHYFKDKVGGKSLTVSYCILCNSGIAFGQELEGRMLDLQCVTAYNNNIIYYDAETDNFIQQLDGRIVHGPDKGKSLPTYPVVLCTWKEWKQFHPNTTLYYAPPTGFRDRMVNGMLQLLIPVHKLARRSRPWHRIQGNLDPRLPAMAFVLGVEINDGRCAYPISLLKEKPVINDQIGGEPIVVMYDSTHDVADVFSRNVNGRLLTFEPLAPDQVKGAIAKDEETGSSWDVTGKGKAGEFRGQGLREIPHYNRLFWFSWALFKPGTRIGPRDAAASGHSTGSAAATQAARL